MPLYCPLYKVRSHQPGRQEAQYGEWSRALKARLMYSQTGFAHIPNESQDLQSSAYDYF